MARNNEEDEIDFNKWIGNVRQYIIKHGPVKRSKVCGAMAIKMPLHVVQRNRLTRHGLVSAAIWKLKRTNAIMESSDGVLTSCAEKVQTGRDKVRKLLREHECVTTKDVSSVLRGTTILSSLFIRGEVERLKRGQYKLVRHTKDGE